jgi:hypothetical protein
MRYSVATLDRRSSRASTSAISRRQFSAPTSRSR